MEAKVDVRKLQLLNDRINQTIEALNQVRMSVHGLAHSGAVPAGQFVGQQGLGGVVPQGQWVQPQLQQAYAQQPYGVTGTPYGYGLLHSSMGQPLLFAGPTQIPQQIPTQAWAPFFGQGIGQGIAQGFGQNVGVGGLAHTGIETVEIQAAEMRASDPNRMAQTFPYVFKM